MRDFIRYMLYNGVGVGHDFQLEHTCRGIKLLSQQRSCSLSNSPFIINCILYRGIWALPLCVKINVHRIYLLSSDQTAVSGVVEEVEAGVGIEIKREGGTVIVTGMDTETEIETGAEIETERGTGIVIEIGRGTETEIEGGHGQGRGTEGGAEVAVVAGESNDSDNGMGFLK